MAFLKVNSWPAMVEMGAPFNFAGSKRQGAMAFSAVSSSRLSDDLRIVGSMTFPSAVITYNTTTSPDNASPALVRATVGRLGAMGFGRT